MGISHYDFLWLLLCFYLQCSGILFSLASLLHYVLQAIYWLDHWDFMCFYCLFLLDTWYVFWGLCIALVQASSNKFRTVLTLSYLACFKLRVYPFKSKWQLIVYNHFLGLGTVCFTGKSSKVLALTQKQYNLIVIWNVCSFCRVKNTDWVDFFTKNLNNIQ